MISPLYSVSRVPRLPPDIPHPKATSSLRSALISSESGKVCWDPTQRKSFCCGQMQQQQPREGPATCLLYFPGNSQLVRQERLGQWYQSEPRAVQWPFRPAGNDCVCLSTAPVLKGFKVFLTLIKKAGIRTPSSGPVTAIRASHFNTCWLPPLKQSLAFQVTEQ